MAFATVIRGKREYISANRPAQESARFNRATRDKRKFPLSGTEANRVKFTGVPAIVGVLRAYPRTAADSTASCHTLDPMRILPHFSGVKAYFGPPHKRISSCAGGASDTPIFLQVLYFPAKLVAIL